MCEGSFVWSAAAVSLYSLHFASNFGCYSVSFGPLAAGGGRLLEVYVAVDLLWCCEAASSFCPVGLRWYLEGYKKGLWEVLEERAWLL